MVLMRCIGSSFMFVYCVAYIVYFAINAARHTIHKHSLHITRGYTFVDKPNVTSKLSTSTQKSGKKLQHITLLEMFAV